MGVAPSGIRVASSRAVKSERQTAVFEFVYKGLSKKAPTFREPPDDLT